MTTRRDYLGRVLLAIAVFAVLIGCQLAELTPPTSTGTPTAPAYTSTPVPPTTQTPTGSSEPPASPAPTLTSTDTPLPPTPSPTPDEAISERHITRGPYLQSVTTDSAIIVWETDQPTISSVVYGRTTACGSRTHDPALTTKHAITITDLAPYTTYYYNVTGRCLPPDISRTFKTAAGPDQTRFSFVVLGDTQSQPDVHRSIVERIISREPDFMLHVGDLVAAGNNASQWSTFFAIERDLLDHVPFFPTVGNHEDGADAYFQHFFLPGNEHWYTFDYGNARFVSLQVDGIGQFKPDTEQYAWLEQTLAANTQLWLIVFFHIPPFSCTKIDYPSRKGQELLVPLFEEYGVDIVFNGHDHNYQRSSVHDITYIITGGGGGPLYDVVRIEDYLIKYEVVHHFVHITADGNTLTGVALTSDGHEIDRFTLTNQ